MDGGKEIETISKEDRDQTVPELKYVKESVLNSETMGSNWEGVCVCVCARARMRARERYCVWKQSFWLISGLEGRCN